MNAPWLYICVTQTWMMFTFPPFVRLISPFNLLLPLITNVAYLSILYDFFTSKEESPLAMKDLDEYPYPDKTRRLIYTFIIITAHIGFIIAYRYDMYHMPDSYLIQLYIHNVVSTYLLYKYRSKALNS